MNTGTDGMKLDRRGNFYLTHERGVWIMAPDGTHLGTIHLPKEEPLGSADTRGIAGVRAMSVAFGDADSKTLYIAGRKNLYRVRTNIEGVRPMPKG